MISQGVSPGSRTCPTGAGLEHPRSRAGRYDFLAEERDARSLENEEYSSSRVCRWSHLISPGRAFSSGNFLPVGYAASSIAADGGMPVWIGV